jgi:hypothetical protein
MSRVRGWWGVLVFSAGCVASPSADSPVRSLGGDPLDGLAYPQDYRAARVSSFDRSGGNADNIPLKPGETATIAEIEGPGCVTHIWFTSVSYFETYAAVRKLVLRVYWDDAQTPCVEAPLGDFFGLGHGQVYAYDCAPFQIGTHGGLNCFWKMPFAKKARITLTNEGEKGIGAFYFYVDYRRYPKLPKDLLCFHAHYRQAWPCVSGRDYALLEATGRGHYVGCNLSIETTKTSWWGEGDDRIYIDGEDIPSLQGTGSEDYFGGAWCYWNEFHMPYLGMPFRARWESPLKVRRYTSRDFSDPEQMDFYVDPWHEGDLWNVYRYHIADPIPFAKSIRVDIEHGHNNDRSDHYSSVAYWYQTEPHGEQPALPKVEARLPKPPLPKLRRSGWYEGEDFVYEGKVEKGDLSTLGVLWIGDLWSDGRTLVFNAKEVGARLTLPLEIPQGGTYQLEGVFVRWKNHGIFGVELDGNRVGGTFDGHQETLLPVTAEGSFGPVALGAGKHILSLVALAKAAGAGAFNIGVDRFRLVPSR